MASRYIAANDNRPKYAAANDNARAELNRIRQDYAQIAHVVNERPELMRALRETYQSTANDNQGMRRASQYIDGIDKIVGPIQTGLRVIGAAGGPVTAAAAYGATGISRLAEWAFLKLPYSIYYSGRRGLWNTVGDVARETAAAVIPFGDIIKVKSHYGSQADSYIRGETARRFTEQYLQPANDNRPPRKRRSLENQLNRVA